MSLHAVITTINRPTEAVRKFEDQFGQRLHIVADKKTPKRWRCGDARVLSLDRQLKAPDRKLRALGNGIPIGHYARKNLGYLVAMQEGAELIYDTDDDNIPNEHWKTRSANCEVARLEGTGEWCNVYRHLSIEPVPFWPRGLPLDKIHADASRIRDQINVYCPVQQGTANHAPDVDAIYRLVFPISAPNFDLYQSVILPPLTWCPFNSQTTWWFKEAFFLMYLPSFVSFRMTDIWRSFVAQRCLWEEGFSVAFHAPAEVIQLRNKHDLMRDFVDEIPGYLHNTEICRRLAKTRMKTGPRGAVTGVNLVRCYESLHKGGFVCKDELRLARLWVDHVEHTLYGP